MRYIFFLRIQFLLKYIFGYRTEWERTSLLYYGKIKCLS